MRPAANNGSPISACRNAALVRCAGDQLGDHGVVERRDCRAFLDAGVDAHALEFGHLEGDDGAGRGQKALGRVLGVEPRLDGMAGHGDLRLRQGQRLARGHAQLPLDQIEAGDRLGHGMLDLQARVHLDEVPRGLRREAAPLNQKFHRSGALVAHGLGAGDGGCGDLRPQLRRHVGRRRLLDHLLVAPLQRAVALEEVHDVATGVAEHLHLDVARPLDHLLQEDARVAECRLRLALGALQEAGEVWLACDEAHAATATAGHRLDHHGVAYTLGLPGERLRPLLVTGITRHDRNSRLGGNRLGLGLAAHAAHGLRRGADELQAGLAHGLREVGVLGEEAVARMDRLGLGLERRGDDLVAAQVALGRGARSDLHHLVGGPREGRAAVGIGDDGNRAHTEPVRGADDADGDLAAVGDQDLLEHRSPLPLPITSMGRGSG
jgi:hypothetical protein